MTEVRSTASTNYVFILTESADLSEGFTIKKLQSRAASQRNRVSVMMDLVTPPPFERGSKCQSLQENLASGTLIDRDLFKG